MSESGTESHSADGVEAWRAFGSDEVAGAQSVTLRLGREAQSTPDEVSATSAWLNDDVLLVFRKEHTQRPEGQRLSDGVGKELW